jgi:hypothetical protein
VSADDDQGLDQGDEGGLWEYQLRPLSVHSLAAALVSLDGELPIEIEFYDGERIRLLHVMHIDLRGEDGRAVTVVMTVT